MLLPMVLPCDFEEVARHIPSSEALNFVVAVRISPP